MPEDFSNAEHPAIHITLPNEMAEQIEKKVESGAYASVSEVVREGIRALLDRDVPLEKWYEKRRLRALTNMKLTLPRRSPLTKSCRVSRQGRRNAARNSARSEIAASRLLPPGGAQLDDLFQYIEGHSGRGPAEAYVEQIISFCIGLGDFPERGMRRDDFRPGMRTVGFRRRATVVFTVRGDRVAILGVFYGGQDFEAVFRDEPE